MNKLSVLVISLLMTNGALAGVCDNIDKPGHIKSVEEHRAGCERSPKSKIKKKRDIQGERNKRKAARAAKLAAHKAKLKAKREARKKARAEMLRRK